jgi:peptidoglycan/LPS O-acetylase OafA/YrhL
MTDSYNCAFDKRQTNIAKGVALLLLLWHHLFYNSPEYYNKFTSLFYFKGVPVECFLADFCKVCVAIFLFLSGYGLYKSYQSYLRSNTLTKDKYGIKRDIIFVKNHLIKMMSSYWFIFIIFVPMGLFFGRSFITYYGFNPVYYLADFFGVCYLLFNYSGTMNVTWWFMSIIIIYYVFFPLLCRIMNWSKEILLLSVLFLLFLPFPDFRQLKLWLCPFVFGMYMSSYNGFNRINNKINTKSKSLIFCLLSICLTAYVRDSSGYRTTLDSIFGFFIILFSYLIISAVPILNRILEELGKYSGQIFMFHTFIFSYYFSGFIYFFKYSILIFIVMTVVCYLVARLLTWLMKITKYNKLMRKLIAIGS